MVGNIEQLPPAGPPFVVDTDTEMTAIVNCIFVATSWSLTRSQQMAPRR